MTTLTMTIPHTFANASYSSTVLGVGRKTQVSYFFPQNEVARFAFFEDSKELVQRLGELEPGWNGYGSKPIQKEVIDRSLSFLVLLAAVGQNIPEPYVSPKENGTIAFSWETETADAYIEFGITRYSGYITSKSLGDLFFGGDAGDIGRDFVLATQENLYAADTRFLVKSYPSLERVGNETSALSFISLHR